MTFQIATISIFIKSRLDGVKYNQLYKSPNDISTQVTFYFFLLANTTADS